MPSRSKSKVGTHKRHQDDFSSPVLCLCYLGRDHLCTTPNITEPQYPGTWTATGKVYNLCFGLGIQSLTEAPTLGHLLLHLCSRAVEFSRVHLRRWDLKHKELKHLSVVMGQGSLTSRPLLLGLEACQRLALLASKSCDWLRLYYWSGSLLTREGLTLQSWSSPPELLQAGYYVLLIRMTFACTSGMKLHRVHYEAQSIRKAVCCLYFCQR